jgi:hypothetical protein
MALRSRLRVASVGVAAVAGLGLLGIAAGPASAGGADPTAGAGGASTAIINRPAVVTAHRYIAHLVGCCEYHFKVFSNHTATSSFIPPDGFIGVWTWTKNGAGTVTFTETNGTGCVWTAQKTPGGYASAAQPGVANCNVGGTYPWYAARR